MPLAAQYYSEGRIDNAGILTMLAKTPPLKSGGVLGANYILGVLATCSFNNNFIVKILDSGGATQTTIYFSILANDSKIMIPEWELYIPNGYNLTVENEYKIEGDSTMQASVFIRVFDTVDKFYE